MAKRIGRGRVALVNEQDRLLTYIPSTVQRDVARKVNNIESQRDILMSYIESAHPGLAFMFNDNYYTELDSFITKIEDKNKRIVSQEMDKQMGLKKATRKQKVSEAKKKRNTVVVRKKSGAKYTKTSNKGFENKKLAVGFIKSKVKEGKTNKEITQEYNAFAVSQGWVTRTESSIYTLRSREKIKK